MRIVIEYDSVWQTSFLDGDPNKPVSKKEGNERKFVATAGTRGESPALITDNTVLGVLYRLIGEQRKLFQIKKNGNPIFSGIEDKISWKLNKTRTENELMYLTNKSDDRCGQGTWLGVISDDNPWFFSKNVSLLWSVLYLDRNEIMEFILSKKANYPDEIKEIDCRPTALLERLSKIADIKSSFGEPWKASARIKKEIESEIKKLRNKREGYVEKNAEKPKTVKQEATYTEKLKEFDTDVSTLTKKLGDVDSNPDNQELDTKMNQCISLLRGQYPDCEFWNDGQLYPQRIFASALYEQAARLISEGVDLPFVIEGKGKDQGDILIKGFSKNSKAHRGFNGARDWLNPMSGGRKKAVGTPCQVRKQSGLLEISIDIERDKAKAIEQAIENAGVSSFYLGKKGLAYVSDIRV